MLQYIHESALNITAFNRADTLYLDPTRRIPERGKIIYPLIVNPIPIHLKEILRKKHVKRVIIKLSPMARYKKNTCVTAGKLQKFIVVAVQNEL
jgi:hypothetical protein